MTEHSFQWRDATVTVQAPNGFSRAKRWRLSSLAQQIEDETVREFGKVVSYHLANTISVDGDIGFPVPNGDVTLESFTAFCEGLGNADETLLIMWDDALWQVRANRTDPDLVPPDEIDPNA